MKNVLENKGITLIALVITIIVLIILGGITLNLVLDENNSLLKKAKYAAEENSKQSSVEKLQLKIASLKIKSYEESKNMPTLQELADALCEDDDIEYVKLASQRIASLEKIHIGENTSIFVKLKAYSHEFEINSSLKVESIDGIKVEEKNNEEVLDKLNVGDIVTYSPSGTYNWQVEYYSSEDKYNSNELKDETLDSSSAGNFNITKWKVFSIDKANKKVELISATPTNGTVFMMGAQAYNNGVTLLNEACSNLYGNTSKGITARSINIEDIENRMTETALTEAHNYEDAAQYGKQTDPYIYKVENEVIGPNTNYPTIYAYENKSVIDETEITSGGLKLSESTTLIGRTTDNATKGVLTASKSLQPYQSHWYKNNAFLQTAFKGEGTNTDNVNYTLIMPNGTKTNYWVASREISVYEDYCAFGMRIVYTGYVGLFACRNSINTANGFNTSLRPIVTLDYDKITGSDKLGWTVVE